MTGEVEVQLQVLDARLGGEFPLPDYATAASAGMDLRAMIGQPMLLEPGASVLVPSGVALYLGDASLCAVILPRSGLGHRHGLVLGNLVGLIDADYQGPLMISLWNRSNSTYSLQPGDRVAQLVLLPVLRARLKAVEAFSATARGAGGFGHTGVG